MTSSTPSLARCHSGMATITINDSSALSLARSVEVMATHTPSPSSPSSNLSLRPPSSPPPSSRQARISAWVRTTRVLNSTVSVASKAAEIGMITTGALAIATATIIKSIGQDLPVDGNNNNNSSSSNNNNDADPEQVTFDPFDDTFGVTCVLDLDGIRRTIRKIKVFGQGGFGRVILCETQASPDAGWEKVALKVARRGKGFEEADWIFAAEVEGLAEVEAMEGDDEMKLLWSGKSEGYYYLALDFFAGGAVSGALKSAGPMSVGRCLLVLSDVVGTLIKVHAHGGMHRDIKPDNLLMRGTEPGARVFLGDWGLSWWDGDSMDWVGTPGYAAPEVTKEEWYDGKADVFALGAVAYELVTGSRLFVESGDKLEDILARTQYGASDMRDWSHPVWSTEGGGDLRKLIVRMCRPSAGERPLVVDLMDEVAVLQDLYPIDPTDDWPATPIASAPATPALPALPSIPAAPSPTSSARAISSTSRVWSTRHLSSPLPSGPSAPFAACSGNARSPVPSAFGSVPAAPPALPPRPRPTPLEVLWSGETIVKVYTPAELETPDHVPSEPEQLLVGWAAAGFPSLTLPVAPLPAPATPAPLGSTATSAANDNPSGNTPAVTENGLLLLLPPTPLPPSLIDDGSNISTITEIATPVVTRVNSPPPPPPQTAALGKRSVWMGKVGKAKDKAKNAGKKLVKLFKR